MNASVANSEADILRRSLAMEDFNMPPDVAKWMLEHLAFQPNDRARMMELYQKAVEGDLSGQEDAELTRFTNVGRLLDMLKLETLKAAPSSRST